MAKKVKERMIKKPEEIVLLKQGGALLATILAEVVAKVVPGVTTAELDAHATRRMYEVGGEPAFLGYRPSSASTPFASTMCISLNNEVVHAPAVPERVINSGDLVKLDIGMRYPAKNGFFTDMAVTVPVGTVKTEELKLIAATHDALEEAIAVVRPGNHISDISAVIERHVKKFGFQPVRDLVGHGVGYAVHEAPEVPNYWMEGLPDEELVVGMVLAIEPIINMGRWQVKALKDGWTIVSADGKPSAHFEHTIVVTQTGCDVLTRK